MAAYETPETPGSGSEVEFTVHSEFATVAIGLDLTANGPRLRIVDMRSGEVGYLDPLELEALAWAGHNRLSELLDPGAARWVVGQ